MRNHQRRWILGVCLLCAHTSFAANAVFDANGRLVSMQYGGDELAVRTNLGAPLPGWVKLSGMEKPGTTEVKRGDGALTWTGVIETIEGQRARFRQTMTERDGATRVAIEVTAEQDLDTEGVYFWVDVPRVEFAGGRVTLGGGAGAKEFVLPRQKPPVRDFLSGEASRLAFAGLAGEVRLDAVFERHHAVFLRDRWTEEGRFYSAFIELHRGRMAKGSTAALALTLSLSGKPDVRPVNLRVDAARPRYRFQGFGGNYCFGIDSPVTEYTLKNLRVAWARTEMSLDEWEPVNDNASPDDVNWAYFESRDTPDSNLRRQFLLAKQIQDKGIPYAISIWKIPEWLYEVPGQSAEKEERRLAQGKWDELLESVGSYLLYAKKRYGVEPDLFSFNEPDLGVKVKFTAEEHRDAIRSFGAYFRKLGLKTKWLLADTANPRDTHTYALAAADDPEAIQYAGAVSVHSWWGGTPEQYAAWGDLAEWLGLPLLVGEFGVDPSAWQGGMYDSFHYGLREVRMYQELLLHARPRAVLMWEFTSDYGIVRANEAAGASSLTPTHRFWFTKQFANLTPRNSDALETASDHPKVLLTAFAGQDGGRRIHTLHIANLGAAREVTLRGLPPEVIELRPVRTSETEDFRELPVERPANGTLTLQVPARCLLTLTTLPREGR